MSKHRGITVQKSTRREPTPKIVVPLASGFKDGRLVNLLEERNGGKLTGFLIEETGAPPDFNRRRSESATRFFGEITPESRWYADIAALAEQGGWVDAIYRLALEELTRTFAYGYETLEAPREQIDYLAQELPTEWQEPARSQLLALLADVAAPAALDATFSERRAGLFQQIVTGIAANILADIETDNITFSPPIPETLEGKWERAYTEQAGYQAQPQIVHAAPYLAIAAARHALEPSLIQATWDRIIERLEEEGELPRRHRRRPSNPTVEAQPAAPAPAMLPGFHSGWGTTPNSLTTRAAILAIQGGADGKWLENPENGFPYFAAPATNFLMSPGDYQTADVAWEAVRSLDDAAVDTFMILCSHYIANRSHTRDGLAFVTPDDVLSQRGIAKHKRAYKPEHREEAAQTILTLGTITIEGHRDGYEPTGRKGKSKRIRVTLEGKLLEISLKARQQTLSNDLAPIPGSDKTAGFWYRLGPWAQGFLGADGAQQLAQASQAILRYHAKNQRHQKRIGWYLVWIFRINRGAQRFQVRTLLEQAGIEVTASAYKNPGRFRAAIEEALEELRRDGVIGSLEWELEALPVRRGLDEWLCSTVRIAPPAALLERYKSIGKPRLHLVSGEQESA